MSRFVSPRWPRRIAAITVLAVCLPLCVPQAVSADPLKDDTSLKYVPSDASFYVAGMRMREIFDKVAASKAVAKLKAIPSVQFGWAMAMAQWENPQNPQVAMFKQMLADPANQQLLDLLKDAISHEVFIYGDSSFADTLDLLSDINAAFSAGQMEALSAGDFQNMQEYQVRKVLEVLDQKAAQLKIPILLKGMKLSNEQQAQDQLKRLEALVNGVLAQQPALQPRFSREQIAGSDFLTFRLDGTLIPWSKILENAQGIDQQQLQKLVEKVSAMTLMISIGVRDSYLLVSIGSDNKHLGTLGQGALLYDREEMAPLRTAADKPITEVTYVSSDFLKRVGTIDRQMDQLVTMARQMAPMMLAGTPQLAQELVADVERFAAYVKQKVPEPGAYSGFNYLTPEGYESYSYNWSSQFALDASQNLTILTHVGGDPIGFYAARGKPNPQTYDDLAEFLSRLAYYGEQIGLQQLDEDQLAAYEKLKTDFLPLIQRIGTVTREKLAPAFADGQSALVLDAKSGSAAWHAAMPPADGELPMIEFAIVTGVSDAGLVKAAFSEIFEIVQQALDKLHEASTGELRDMFPNPIPPIKLARPSTKEVPGGTVYYYALPEESGLDAQMAPNAGLSDKFMAASIFPRFTARLLADAPLQGAGPLANTNRPLAAAYHLDFARLMGAISPWVDYGFALSMAVSTNVQPGGGPMGNIPQQVHDVMDILSCFRGVSGVTYLEGKAMVTHSQCHFEDLQ